MNNSRIILILLVLLAFIAAFWYFTDIFIYIFVAIILSILGSPLVNFLVSLKVKGRSLPKSVAAAVVLILIFTLLTLAGYFFIPLIVNELQQLGKIDTTMVVSGVQEWLRSADLFLIEHHWLPEDSTILQMASAHVNDIFSMINISSIFENLMSFATGFFIFLFSVIFMTFFALKDTDVFWTLMQKLIPTTLRGNFDTILSKTKGQLVRYFSGVFLEMIIIGLLDGFICYFLGVPKALLIGLIAGLLNVIPYVGPLIAAGISLLLGIAATLTLGMPSAEIPVVIIKIISTFVSVKLLDDFVLQPVIYGKSVDAHPLEIFIVILIAGKVGGIFGMIFAVPAYTLVRIIVKEFFGSYFVEKSKL